MSAPVVTAITPANMDTDIVLGSPITVTFDQPIDPASINGNTFTLFGPGQVGVITPTQMAQVTPFPSNGREFIQGSFSFPTSSQFVFTPNIPLRPNLRYTVLLVGSSSLLVKNAIKNPAGDSLAQSFQISFETGDINQTTQPTQAPLGYTDPNVLPWMKPKLDPATITVIPRQSGNNDLTQTIELIFPADIDPTLFDVSTIAVSVEPIANDPLVVVPTGLQTNVTISGNRLIITVGSWPVDSPPPVLPPPPPPPYTPGDFEDLPFPGINPLLF